MMPVEARTNPAVVVDGAPTHGAGWASGADDDGSVGGECLHLGEVGLEMTGGRLVPFVHHLHQRDFERLLLLAVGERHETDAPPGRDWLLERHVGQRAGRRDRHAGEDYLQPLGERTQLVLLEGQADQLAAGAQLQVELALARLSDGPRGDAGDLFVIEAFGRHRFYSPARLFTAPGLPAHASRACAMRAFEAVLLDINAGRWGSGPLKRG